MSRLELEIAWRYLRSRRGSKLLSLISVIAIGGVMVGVSALIIIIGVMNGLQTDLREKILVGSPDVRVLTYGEDLKITGWRPIVDKVRQLPGVVAAAPFVLTQGLISAGHAYAEGVYAAGIPAQTPDAPNVTQIRAHATAGDFRFASADGLHRGIVLGKLLAARLNAYPGDKVLLVSPTSMKMSSSIGGIVPQVFTFEVTGLFETGMYEYDNAYVYMALDVAQQFAGLDSSVTGIEVRTTNRWSAAKTGDRIAESLGFPYRTMDWEQQNKSLFSALKLEKLAMSVILLLIVIVAAFNIVSTLTMVVGDKTREIGILRAMGMRASSIRRIFFAQGLFIGLVGTGLGLALGLAGAVALDRYRLIALDPQVYFIDHLPVATQLLDVGLIVLASLVIAAVATLYPAWQAAKLFPVEAIRHD
ncbi:MAG: lipoprotein-releasing ABC transporter permease subunit [Gemmatimonadaceae bacterium]